MLEQLIHNGILIPPVDPPLGLEILVRGELVQLSPKQEEMALAWALKKDTDYAQDPVFCANFLSDFSKELGISEPLSLDEVDFASCYDLVDTRRAKRAAQTKEERRALAAERKAQREALKAHYGYAILNGQRVELGTYMVEPSGIFMGRGQHPMRGRWKEGSNQRDVTLNYGPDPMPEAGNWDEIVWQPESLWVARWKDKLSDKLKYIWLADTAPVKQEREAAKFDKATKLDKRLARVRRHIRTGLVDDDARTRQVATAAYLIDALCLRVGDEKDLDEADTVGATTLRPEHLTFQDDGSIVFRFLGKDSVEWHKTLKPPEQVLANLKVLAAEAEVQGAAQSGAASRDMPQLFPRVSSTSVNAFFSDAMPELTAKVFRTHHATRAVQDTLSRSRVEADDPDYAKWRIASRANLRAAELCNHTKQLRSTWERSRARYRQRISKSRQRLNRYKQQVRDYRVALASLKVERKEKVAAAREAAQLARERLDGSTTPERKAKNEERLDKARARVIRTRQRYDKRLGTARRRIESAVARRERAELALGKLRAQYEIAREKRAWNTSTSLKSYIDPRVYHRWGAEVNYDVISEYYPSTLRRKFAWVRDADGESETNLVLRPCQPSDLVKVTDLFGRVRDEYALLDLPIYPADLADRYYPQLDKPWRSLRIVLDETEQKVLAAVAVGPVWLDEDQPCLDLYGVLDADQRPKGLTTEVLQAVEDALQAYETQHPTKRGQIEPVLRPSSRDWLTYAPELEEALALDAKDQGPDQD